MYNRYKERFKNLFSKKRNCKVMYEQEQKKAERWEFKYNKLKRHLAAILKETEQ